MKKKILHADSRLVGLEHELFSEIRAKVSESVDRLRKSAGTISEIDCLLSLAQAALVNNYRKPLVGGGFDDIKIIDGRHPVVEKNINTAYVPNDIEMDIDESRLTIITGPNMAGKSTYLRMCALITLMAHIGSFVLHRRQR